MRMTVEINETKSKWLAVPNQQQLTIPQEKRLSSVYKLPRTTTRLMNIYICILVVYITYTHAQQSPSKSVQ